MPEPKPDERAFLTSALGGSAGCPDLAALAVAEPGSDLQRHLAVCSRCRTELAVFREFENAAPRPEELASVQWIQAKLRRREPRPAGRLRTWLQQLFSPARRTALTLAAASVFVIAAAGLYFNRSAEPQLSAPAGPPVWRSGRFAALSPAGDITAPPTEFRWEAVTGAATYHIELREVDGSPVWSAESGPTSLAIPQAVQRLMQPGRAFQWEAAARSSAGEEIASSNSQTFHILATRP